MYPSSLADTGDCSEGVTTTSIGVIDDPPDIITTTYTCPDDSKPTNSSDPNSTTNTTQHIHVNTIFKNRAITNIYVCVSYNSSLCY